MKLSIIIPVFNEFPRISKVIDKVVEESIFKKEIIIIDDFSYDVTSELLKENISTDRTVYDVCSFTFSAKSIYFPHKKTFVEAAVPLVKMYDVVFYISPEGIEIEDNGIRTTDPDYRMKIDMVIQAMLNEYPPNKLVKISGTTEQRIEQIKEALSL
jgi:hypothetical protein